MLGRKKQRPTPGELDQITQNYRDLDQQAKRGEFEHLEDTREWAGRWELDRVDMTWWREEHCYRRSIRDNKVHQSTQKSRGALVRPPQMEGVNHLRVPLVVIRSHPDTPEALSDENEGRWMETNPAWPELSVNCALGDLGVEAVWSEASADVREEIEIVPALVGDMHVVECMPFDAEPLALSGILIYARPVASSE